jgi:hypothetical protein
MAIHVQFDQLLLLHCLDVGYVVYIGTVFISGIVKAAEHLRNHDKITSRSTICLVIGLLLTNVPVYLVNVFLLARSFANFAVMIGCALLLYSVWLKQKNPVKTPPTALTYDDGDKEAWPPSPAIAYKK